MMTPKPDKRPEPCKPDTGDNRAWLFFSQIAILLAGIGVIGIVIIVLLLLLAHP